MEFTINKDAKIENLDDNCEEVLGEPCWKLIDKQGGNLGNIQTDEFPPGDYDSILDRLDNYYHDYNYYFLYEIENLGVSYSIVEEIDTI